MAQSRKDGIFEVKPFPIIGQYNLQRFRQWSPEDTANWYVVKGIDTKRPFAMYPVMGRAHINYLGFNQLIFGSEPRGLFKSVSFAYCVVGNAIFRIDENFNTVNITSSQPLQTFAGDIYFSYLVVNTIVFSCFVDSQKIYIYREDTGQFVTVTDINAPGNGTNGKPGFIATFGNRITVSVANSSQFILSIINLGGSAFDPANCFTNATGQVFAQEEGIIRQLGVLNNTLYIFTDYRTGIWSNIPSIFTGTNIPILFPWKKNTTYDWNYGIANPKSLDIDFNIISFLGRNSDGLLQFMISSGGIPTSINNKAISTLLQRYSNSLGNQNPFLVSNSSGFLYQYENTVFYRMSGGDYFDYGLLDQELTADSVEYSFEDKSWHRCIELNGERNRIQYHVYFNNRHLVSLVGDSTVYQMGGQFYFNEIRNKNQPNPQAPDSYLAYPFRYERVTSIISEIDYSEFETEYVEIDFVFGDSNINFSVGPFQNTQFLVAERINPSNGQIQYMISEQSDSDGQPVFFITDNSNTPQLNDTTYNALFKPSIELFYSDNGGISYNSADVRQFSQQGVYIWKMRWYQLGSSRNRVYKLICVSPVPIVVLGGVMNVRRISGGAN